MPVTGDVSTSVMPPVIEPTVMPTAPDGTPASSMVFSASAVSARTGASLTEVTVIGGEAYLRDDWLEIIARIASHGMRCGMATGGRGLPLERARAARDAGLSAVSVSVDGIGEVHDEQRGLRGSFDAAMAAMEHVRSVGKIRLTANSQVNKKNLQQLPELFRRLAAQGAKAWQVQLTAAMGRAADEPRLFLEPYEVLYVHPTLARLRREADALGVAFWAGNNIGYFGPFESVLRRQYATGHRGTCGAGKITLGVEAAAKTRDVEPSAGRYTRRARP